MPLNAKLTIETAVRAERTILKSCFCTQPFKVANVSEDKQQKTLLLMLMSASPGVLDGDRYEMNIVVGEGCRLALETQSFQRLYQMKEGASQTMRITMEKGSSFCYLPHPVVPHQGANFQSRTQVFLAEECSLLWGEVICCGRKQNGEIFQFTSYHSLTEVYRKGKLVIKENLLMKPAETNLAAIGQLEGYTHQATLLYLDESTKVSALVDAMVNHFRGESSIAFGVSALPVNGIIIRLLGHKAEQLFQLVRSSALLLQGLKESHSVKTEVYVA